MAGQTTKRQAEQARHYCDRVVQSGGRCEFMEVAGASHRSENWWPGQWDYKRLMVEWLAESGRPTTVNASAACQ